MCFFAIRDIKAYEELGLVSLLERCLYTVWKASNAVMIYESLTYLLMSHDSKRSELDDPNIFEVAYFYNCARRS